VQSSHSQRCGRLHTSSRKALLEGRAALHCLSVGSRSLTIVSDRGRQSTFISSAFHRSRRAFCGVQPHRCHPREGPGVSLGGGAFLSVWTHTGRLRTETTDSTPCRSRPLARRTRRCPFCSRPHRESIVVNFLRPKSFGSLVARCARGHRRSVQPQSTFAAFSQSLGGRGQTFGPLVARCARGHRRLGPRRPGVLAATVDWVLGDQVRSRPPSSTLVSSPSHSSSTLVSSPSHSPSTLVSSPSHSSPRSSTTSHPKQPDQQLGFR
jgi:hypothetical protein